MMYTISEEVLNKVLALLVTLPFQQSSEVIGAIQNGIERVEPTEETE